MYNMFMNISIYIYIEREREMYIYIYIYIYVCLLREGGVKREGEVHLSYLHARSCVFCFIVV